MQFYIHRNGQKLGPYAPEEVRSMLIAGTLQSTDLAWHEGAVDWAPLTSFPSIVGPTPPGTAIPPNVYAQPHTGAQPTQTSGLAISSLVLGILSFFTLFLTAIPAIICGHVSLSQIKKSGGRISGRGLAIGGLATAYFACFFGGIAVLAGIALPVFSAVNDRGRATKCMSQAKQIAIACKLYAMDHKGNYPASLDELVPDYLTDRNLFVCPMTQDKTAMGYEYFGGKDSDPADKILLESKATTRSHKRVIITSDGSGSLKRE